MPGIARFDPHHERVLREPYAVYEHYRRHDPVHWGQPYAPGTDGCWYLFRHDHVVAFLRDRRFRRKWSPERTEERIRASPPEQRPYLRVLDRLLLSTDPPAHRRLRTLVSKAFAQRTVDSYRPMVQRATERVLDTLPRSAAFDLIDAFAAPLSGAVICAVLGAPAELGPDLRTWITRFSDGLDLRKRTDTMTAAAEATDELLGYFTRQLAERRRAPRDDLVSALLSARDEEDRLTEDELLAMIIQLVFAGHETTVQQIGATVLNLVEHRDELARVLSDPGLVPKAVAESLRRAGSVHSAAARKPVQDVRIGEKLIRAGEPVIAFVASANRDPEVFPDPDRFDLDRDTSASVAFGAGIHFCLGAPLARLETETAVGALLRRMPGLQTVPGSPPRYRSNTVLPGIAALPVRQG